MSADISLSNVEWYLPRNSPFQVEAIHFFCCEYKLDKIDFNHRLLQTIKIPEILSRAIHKRKAEYIMGRSCASQALKLLNIDEPVAANDDRSPNWPEGIIGSITHTSEFCMAAVTSNTSWSGLGIDSELISNCTKINTFANQFMSVSELDLGFRNNIPQQKWLFTAFSAKESVFKSLYPLIKSYFGFFEVEIISVYPFNQKEGTLKIKLSKYLSDLLQRFTIDCMYIHEGNFVHTLVIF